MPLSRRELFKNEAVKEYLTNLVGEEGLKVAKKLPSKEYESEYDIAEKLKININKLRSILYKLYSQNLVAYYKTRDKEKGWFIYHWKFFPKKLIEQVIKTKQKELEKTEKEVETGNERYFCERCEEDFTFQQAFNNNFACSTCNSPLELKKVRGHKTLIKKIKKEIKELENMLQK